jgi:hypothetical protein
MYLSRAEAAVKGITALGYPAYMATILGVCAIVPSQRPLALGEAVNPVELLGALHGHAQEVFGAERASVVVLLERRRSESNRRIEVLQ